MRRIVIAVMSTVSALVLLFAYPTSTNRAVSSAPEAGSGSGSGSGSGAGTDTTSTASGTFVGAVAQTRWGPVQVQITVADGTITAAEATEYPSGNGRDQEINAYALPVLAREVTSAQSADIDAVSGATVTSDGYISSLQDAIDQAFA